MAVARYTYVAHQMGRVGIYEFRLRDVEGSRRGENWGGGGRAE